MRKLLAVATLVAIVASTAASAAARPFSGPFVGVQAGWGRRTIDAFAVDDRRSGVDYGAFAGLDLRLGDRLVVGAEGDIGEGGRTLSRTFAGVGPTRFDPGRNWSASGRVGILVSPKLLAFGRVGYGSERLKATFSNSTPSLARTTPDGMIVGGGLDYALVRNVSVRAEYRYSNFDGSYNPRQLLIGAAFRF